MRESLRSHINHLLRLATGYELRRMNSARELVGLTPEESRIISGVADRTMTSPIRLINAINAALYVERNNIRGAIVECGVWRGGTSMAMARALMSIGASDRQMVLFDTFAGMTAPSSRDVRLEDGERALDLDWETDSEARRAGYVGGVAAFSSLEDVRAGMRSTGYPSHLVTLVEGDVLETFSRDAPTEISVLRLDTDWYESTLVELEVGWPLLSTGGVLIIDDYDYWSGARRAVDEFFRGMAFAPLLSRMDEGRIVIKP